MPSQATLPCCIVGTFDLVCMWQDHVPRGFIPQSDWLLKILRGNGWQKIHENTTRALSRFFGQGLGTRQPSCRFMALISLWLLLSLVNKHCSFHCKQGMSLVNKHCSFHCKQGMSLVNKHCSLHCKQGMSLVNKHCSLHCKQGMSLVNKHCSLHCKQGMSLVNKHCSFHCKQGMSLVNKHCSLHCKQGMSLVNKHCSFHCKQSMSLVNYQDYLQVMITIAKKGVNYKLHCLK